MMAALVTEPNLEQRRAWGADRHDEVWEGVYVMAPLPNNEHQEIVGQLVAILEFLVGWPGLAKVFPGVNLAGLTEDWEHDYRAPDVVVFLKDTLAQSCDTHWRGGADLVVEVLSVGDRGREKIPFYSRIGVRELLIIDRHPWSLELYRRQGNRLELFGRSDLDHHAALTSETVPLQFRLVAGSPRPRVQVTHVDRGQTWMI
jgi:Uma2 family endonuclease